MKRIIKLSESDLTRIIRKTINESKRSLLMEVAEKVTVSIDCDAKTIDGVVWAGVLNLTHCKNKTTQNKVTTQAAVLPSGPGQIKFDNVNANGLINLGITKESITWDKGNGYDIYINDNEWNCGNQGSIETKKDNPDFVARFATQYPKISIDSVVPFLQKQCQSFYKQRISGI
jgi:hypothetical protein